MIAEETLNSKGVRPNNRKDILDAMEEYAIRFAIEQLEKLVGDGADNDWHFIVDIKKQISELRSQLPKE